MILDQCLALGSMTSVELNVINSFDRGVKFIAAIGDDEKPHISESASLDVVFDDVWAEENRIEFNCTHWCI